MTQPFQQPNLSLKNFDDMQQYATYTSHSLSNPMSWRLKNKWKWLETGSRRCIQSPVIINNQVASTRPTLHLSADTEQREERVSAWMRGGGGGRVTMLGVVVMSALRLLHIPGVMMIPASQSGAAVILLTLSSIMVSLHTGSHKCRNFAGHVLHPLINWTFLVSQGDCQIYVWG